MAPRKKKETAPKEDANPLVEGLKFVSIAQQEIGITYQCHCRIAGGFISAFNGLLAAGVPYEQEFTVCPHTFRLIDAFERLTGVSSLTVLPTNQIHLKDDKRFSAKVACVPIEDMQSLEPDPANWPLNDSFKKAAAVAGLFTLEGAQSVVQASLMIRDGSVIGTDGRVMIEAWHGNPMPPGLIIPKLFVAALNKITKPLKAFGFSDTSFTGWFEDNSYLRTQVYNERWPNIDQAFDFFNVTRPVDPPEGFFAAVKAVASFSGDGRVYLAEDTLQSHRDPAEGATYVVKGLQAGQSFLAKYLTALEPHVTKIDMNSNAPVATFFGGVDDMKIRGIISKST